MAIAQKNPRRLFTRRAVLAVLPIPRAFSREGEGREEERVRESALLGSVNPGTFPRINLPRFPPPETTLLPIPSDVKRERRTRRCRNSEMSFPCSSRASPSRLFTSRARFIRRLTPVYVYGRAAHGRRRRGRRCNRRASECFFFPFFFSRILHSFLLKRSFVHVVDEERERVVTRMREKE